MTDTSHELTYSPELMFVAPGRVSVHSLHDLGTLKFVLSAAQSQQCDAGSPLPVPRTQFADWSTPSSGERSRQLRLPSEWVKSPVEGQELTVPSPTRLEILFLTQFSALVR